MPVLCGSIKVAASVTSTSVAAASTFNSKRISRGTADRISISDDERVKLACSTVNRYMPKDLLRAHRVSHAGTMRIDQGGGVGNQHFGGRGLHLQFQTDLARHGRPDLDQ